MRAVRFWVSSIILAAGSVAVAPQAMSQQEATSPDSASLQSKVEELDQKVRVLERLRELAADSAAAAAKDKVSATASGKDGFSIKSADGKFSLKFRGLVQTDARFFLSDSAFPVTNNFFVRRARPILDVVVGKYLEFRLQPDFGQGTTVLFDAYSDVKVSPAFAVRVGKFKPPVDLERLQSASDIVFAERTLATNLAPNRDIGLQLSGEISGGVLAWQAGIFNGVPDLGNGDGDVSDAKDFAGRVFIQPFKTGSLAGLGVGVAGTTGIERGTSAAPTLAAYRTPGQQTWFRYASSTTTPASNVYRRWAPVATRAAGLLLHRIARPPRRVHPVVSDGQPGHLRHGQAEAHGVAGDRLLLPDRRKELVAERHAQEAFRPEGGHLRRAGAGRALQRARDRRRHLPELRLRGRHADQGKGVGRRAQLVPGTGHQARGGLRAHDLHGRCRHGRSRSRKLRRDPRAVRLLTCTPHEATRLPCALDSPFPARSLSSPSWPAPAGPRHRERPSPSPC